MGVGGVNGVNWREEDANAIERVERNTYLFREVKIVFCTLIMKKNKIVRTNI